MKIIYFFLLLAIPSFCNAQYSKEKLVTILTGGTVKSWNAVSTNEIRQEKVLSFNKNNTVKVVMKSGSASTKNWQLSSADNIRWIITIGKEKYELIVSYDKKGKEYIKLTQYGENISSGAPYEIRLTNAE